MARTGIQFEDVRDAAEALLGRGLNPTIQRVREMLGTGSNTTISEHLKHWQRQLAEAPKIVLPPSVPEAVALALDAFWKIAVQHAEAAFDEQRALAAQAVVAAEHARDAAIADQRQLHTESERLRQQLEAMQATARDLADRLLVEQERRANAETAIQAAEQRVQTAVDTLSQMRAETTARVAQWEATTQQMRTDLEQQLAKAQQRFEIERQRGEASDTRLIAMLDQLRVEQSAERQDWNRRETSWRERIETQHTENVQLKANLTAAGERRANVVAELAQLRLAAETANTHYLAAVREAEALRGELKAVHAEREHLRQQQESRLPNATDVVSAARPQREKTTRKAKI